MQLRNLSDDEANLLKALIKKAKISTAEDLFEKIKVKTMDDGGMGSLLLFPDGIEVQGRRIGIRASEIQFKDSDGVPVLVSLNIDNNNKLFEIDSWKMNYQPLLKIPVFE